MEKKILFAFESESSFLIEVKRTDLPNTVPKDQRVHWLLISKSDFSVQKLRFKSMISEGLNQHRCFEEGELIIQPDQLSIFSTKGRAVEYKSKPANEISADINFAIDRFLSN